MGKKRLIIVLVLMAAVFGVIIFLLFPSPEPVYQGKTLSAWLDQYGTYHWSQRKDLKEQTENALRHFGTNQIPAYLKMLSSRASPVAMYILRHVSPTWLARVHLPTDKQYEADMELRRRRGSYGLIALGADAKPAVPGLITRLKSPYGPVRHSSMITVRWLGPVARDALPSVIKCADDPVYDVRCEAIIALGTIHEDAGQVVPLLLDIMKKESGNNAVRGITVEALDQFDTGAEAAIPAFCDALKDPDVTTRLVSLRALGRIHAQPEIAVPALTANLSRERTNSLNNYYFTILALAQYGPDARPAVPAILSFARESDPQTRAFVLLNLKKIDPDAAARAETK